MKNLVKWSENAYHMNGLVLYQPRLDQVQQYHFDKFNKYSALHYARFTNDATSLEAGDIGEKHQI